MTNDEIEKKILDLESKLIALMNDYAELKHDVREPQSGAHEIINHIKEQANLIRGKLK